ncbi:MAG TPA: PIG-L family deacetylase [Rhodanobacteraceae bacterium]|nr:PIG-L family deacetylase [Rhodanobacteraceae bacterium]
MALSATAGSDALATAINADARVLVVAPHPDDESLAAGGLLHRAVTAGAAVRVLLLTDGDNNPWPQRWLERRWRIDAAARRRWGQRRRQEATHALTALGVPPAALHALGWPDLGVTEQLLDHGAAARAALVAGIDAFAPNLLVAPSLADSHPDHSAAAILLEQALRHTDAAPWVISYRIHGHRAGARLPLALTPAEIEVKQRAVLAYASQLSLSRGRLLAMVGAEEAYATPVGIEACPWHFSPLTAATVGLLVVDGERAWRQAWLPPAQLLAQAAARTDAARPLYIKPYSRLQSPWIFDRYGWWRLR